MANESLDGRQIKVASIPNDRLENDGAVPPDTIGATEIDGADGPAIRDKIAVDFKDSKTPDIASTATLSLQALYQLGNFTDVTGTTTVTAITLNAGREHTLRFLGALTLTHNASTLILPGGTNYTTAAGDVLTFRGITGGVVCTGITRASGGFPFTRAYDNTGSPAVITSAGSISLTHGLGAAPSLLQLSLVCVTGEADYSTGDVIAISAGSNSNRGVSATLTSTSIVIRFGSDANAFQAAHKTTGATTALTNANWNLIVRAWR